MSAIPKNLNKQCPHWSVKSKKCQISGDGLFIPQEDHTEIYCTTSSFPQCLQFILHAENQLEIVEKRKKTKKNRRQYIRVDASHKVTIGRVGQPDQQVGKFSIVARTVDLSMGGLRLATDNPLKSNTLVELIFDESFPKNLHEATGLVSWCNKQIDEPGYQVGISFKNDKVIKDMGDFLN